MEHNNKHSDELETKIVPDPHEAPSLDELISSKFSNTSNTGKTCQSVSADKSNTPVTERTELTLSDIISQHVAKSGPSIGGVVTLSDIINPCNSKSELSTGGVVTLGDLISSGHPTPEVVLESETISANIQLDGSSTNLADMINAHQNLETSNNHSAFAQQPSSSKHLSTCSVVPDLGDQNEHSFPTPSNSKKTVPPGFDLKPTVSHPFSLAELMKQQTYSLSYNLSEAQDSIPPQSDSNEHENESFSLSKLVVSSLSLTEKASSNEKTIVVVCESCRSSMVGVVLANTGHRSPVLHRRSQRVLRQLRRRYFACRRFNFSTPSPDDYVKGQQQRGFK